MFRRNVVLIVAALTFVVGGLHAQLTTPLDSAAMAAFKWRSIGPANMGGRVTDVEGLPSPSKTFYVAGASSGIWKTTNNGTTFKQIWTNDRVVSMGDLAIAPSDPNQIWAGTGEEDSRNSISPGGGIFKSNDAGETWELKGLVETQTIGRIVVHPTNPDIVYVAAVGHTWDFNPERGLYRTTDGGETWELIKFISDKAGFVDVAMHPDDPNVLFAASWERVRGPWFLQSGGPGSALWKSTDGGDSWTEVSGGGFPTTMKGRIGIAISQSNPDIIYAMVEAEEEDDGSGGNGLYRSDDGGATWEKMNDANTRPFYYSGVAVDPMDPDRVYFSSVPLLFSDDGGKTTGSTAVGVHTDDHALWIDPNDPERMVNGNDGGVAITYDRGGNWHYLNYAAMGQFYDVSYNMEVPYRVCGGLQDNYTWCAPSRVPDGELGKYHWFTVGGGDGFYSAQDPEDPNIVWSEMQGGGMRRGNLGSGESVSLEKPDWREKWLPYQDSIVLLLERGVSENDRRIRSLRERASADSAAYDMRWNWNTPFFQSVHNRSWFYAGGNRVVKSTDWGDDLTPISPDLSYNDPEKVKISTETTGGITVDATGAETYATITTLAESPIQQGMIFAGTDDGRVWMTRDDGDNWTELTGNFTGVPEQTYVSRIEPSNHDVDRFYVTFDGHRTNDFTPYVYVTEDGGQTFRTIASNLPTGSVDFVHVITEDPRNENLLFVGTDLGAYVSTDRGGSWQKFMNGLPTVPVHDLEIHPRDRELIAATHGRSIWIVDIAPLQDLTDQMIADDAALFEPKPAYQFGYPPRGGEFYAQSFFERPTPGAEAEISYFIGEELAAALQEEYEANRPQRGPQAGGPPPSAGQRPEMSPQGPPEAPGGPQRGPGSAQVEIVVTNAAGDTINALRGPAGPGIHKVEWNFRGPRSEAEEPGPYEKRERERIAARARVVADSVIEAGWPEAMVNRMVGAFTGESDPQAMMRMFGGGGEGGDPEEFQERPAEQTGSGRQRGGYSEMREFGELIMPGQSIRSLMRTFFSSGGQAGIVDPGSYTVTLKAGEHSFTQTLRVQRVAPFSGRSSGF
jgi:photosystem II stability/assembly factor-like uncharacterized protein